MSPLLLGRDGATEGKKQEKTDKEKREGKVKKDKSKKRSDDGMEEREEASCCCVRTEAVSWAEIELNDRALAEGAEAVGFLERVLVAQRQPGSNLFQSLDPAPERWFVAQLRQKVLAELPLREPKIEIGLDTVDAAFAPLTLTEKVAAWTETMRYDAEQAAAMLRMSPETVAKIRQRSAELVRGQADAWHSTLLAENGRGLGMAAAAATGKDCLPAKVFLEVLDGRATWRGREQSPATVMNEIGRVHRARSGA